MARIITKEIAERIAEKLRAVKQTSKKKRPHDLYIVVHRGTRIAAFGIRRGSEKDKGNDHIPGQIMVGPRDARLLGTCAHTLEWWIQEMRNKGVIEDG